MVNKLRGEVEVNLNQKAYKTKLSLDGIVRIETELGKSILEVANDLMQQKVKMQEVITILTQAIRGGGNNMTPKQIGQEVYSAGLIESFRVCGEILTNTITGGQEEVEKNEETESKPTN